MKEIGNFSLFWSYTCSNLHQYSLFHIGLRPQMCFPKETVWYLNELLCYRAKEYDAGKKQCEPKKMLKGLRASMECKIRKESKLGVQILSSTMSHFTWSQPLITCGPNHIDGPYCLQQECTLVGEDSGRGAMLETGWWGLQSNVLPKRVWAEASTFEP